MAAAAIASFNMPRRRALLLGTLASLSKLPATAKDEPDASLLEDKLLQSLDNPSRSLDNPSKTISALEALGGSQQDQTVGIGSYGSWLGSWDVLYGLDSPLVAGAKLADARGVTLSLIQQREFIFEFLQRRAG